MKQQLWMSGLMLGILFVLSGCGVADVTSAVPTSGTGQAPPTATLIATPTTSGSLTSTPLATATTAPISQTATPTAVVSATVIPTVVVSGTAVVPPEGETKVGICHRTDSEAKPYNFIEVGQSAIPDHQAHGDIIGATSQADSPALPATTPVTEPENEIKVGICHQTNSAKNPYNYIQVGESAVPAHQAHGDIIGATSEADCPAALPDNTPKPGNPNPGKPENPGNPNPGKPEEPAPQPAPQPNPGNGNANPGNGNPNPGNGNPNPGNGNPNPGKPKK